MCKVLSVNTLEISGSKLWFDTLVYRITDKFDKALRCDGGLLCVTEMREGSIDRSDSMDTDNSCYEDCPEPQDTDEDEEDDDGADYVDEYNQIMKVRIGYIAKGKDRFIYIVVGKNRLYWWIWPVYRRIDKVIQCTCIEVNHQLTNYCKYVNQINEGKNEWHWWVWPIYEVKNR